MSALRLVLSLASAQSHGQWVPEPVKPVVAHLQNNSDLGRLRLVGNEPGLRWIAADPSLTLQKPDRHEGIREILRRS
ncbi:MAG: hypothetical protein WCH40_09040 [Verrucomicrobiales bacterium]